MDVKNTVEVLDAVTNMMIRVKAAMADGKISVIEAVQLTISEFPALYAAVSGADKIPSEIGDIDVMEAKLLAEKGLMLAKAVSALMQK